MEEAAPGANPMFTHIETCEFLKRYCQKQTKQEVEEVKAEEAKEDVKTSKDIEKKLAGGMVALAQGKQAKMDELHITTLANKKGKKGGRKNQAADGEGKVDFGIIKKFNSLKLTVPMNPEDFEKAIKDIDALKDALTYWGKIV